MAKLRLEPVKTVGVPTGDVAYMRMPVKLQALSMMDEFIEEAYGKGCRCCEEPKGWLKVSTPKGKEDNDVQDSSNQPIMPDSVNELGDVPLLDDEQED